MLSRLEQPESAAFPMVSTLQGSMISRSPAANGGHAVGKRDAFKTCTTVECPGTDPDHAVRYGNARKADAALKCPGANAGQSMGWRDAFDAGA